MAILSTVGVSGIIMSGLRYQGYCNVLERTVHRHTECNATKERIRIHKHLNQRIRRCIHSKDI